MFNSQFMDWEQVLKGLNTKSRQKIEKERTVHMTASQKNEMMMLCKETPFPILNKFTLN